ncbi:acyltransferase family protein [Aminobacter ciceronei]|jgi:peptidoglycan/LPS O-acetylase OafA/YrhL|uniref:acyltransferase family protein n=1 Tax=Aminobacter ciceronei TaxID=150723 RepID=UPI003F727D6D
MTTRPKLEGANVVRFIAAMMIVMFHVALMPKLAMPDELEFIKNFGGFGVPLFYMLSAFALCYGYFGKLDNADQIRRFYNRRFWRIAPLFYVMMAYYVVYLSLMYGAPPSLSEAITSATFTFNLIPSHVTGFVYASWSIGVEMLFYAIFPVALLAISNLARATVAFVLSVFIVDLWIGAFAGSDGVLKNLGNFSLIAHIHYFSGGMLTFFVWREVTWTPTLRRAHAIVATGMLVGLIFMSGYLHQIFGKPILTAVWATAFGILILGLSFERASAPLRTASQLGEASFSLYLLHPAIIALMTRVGLYDWLYSTLPGDLSAYIACLAVTLAALFPLSMLTYEHIERRFYQGREEDTAPRLA